MMRYISVSHSLFESTLCTYAADALFSIMPATNEKSLLVVVIR